MTPDPEVRRARAIGAALAALAALAPAGVRVGVRRIASSDEAQLLDVEREFVRSARDTRRREFATGRTLLRELLRVDVAILVGPDRRPVVPDGVQASLAHDEHVAVAAVSIGHGIRAIGVDIERAGALEPDVAEQVLRPDDEVADPMLAFVLKESAYKAWSNLGGRMLHHHEMRISVVADGTFTAIVEPDGDEFTGHYALAASTWLALVVVAPVA